MNRVKIPLWVVLAACLGCLALGGVRAQDPVVPGEYPFLPARYGEAYIPSVAEWQAMRLTLFGSIPSSLTDHFIRRNQTCLTTSKGLLISLDLEPRPGWNGFAGGRLTQTAEQVTPALEAASKAAMGTTRRFFSEVKDENVFLQITIMGTPVAAWENGKLRITAAPKPAS